MTEGPVSRLKPSRRQVLIATLLIGGTIGAGAPLLLSVQSRKAAKGVASEEERRLLERVADLVIPATGTAGAVAVGVPAFLELALNHGLDGTRDPGEGVAIVGANGQRPERGGLFLIGRLREALDRQAGGDFLTADRERQAAALTAVDAAAFGPDGKDHVWHKIKNLILLGYYSSEVGASKELAYEPVPGRWEPDVPLARYPRAFSSDWTAVDFG